MTTILLINGPPRSGKDMAATFIRKDLGATECTDLKMSKPLKDMFQHLFCFTDMQAWNLLEKEKDEPSPHLHGLTPRQVQIQLSEDFCKPRFGEEFFGECFVRMVNQSAARYITVSDCGFDREVAPLIRAFGSGSLFCLQLEREGTSFENDSRSYIDYRSLGIQGCRINNQFDLEMYRIQLRRALKWIPRMQELLETS